MNLSKVKKYSLRAIALIVPLLFATVSFAQPTGGGPGGGPPPVPISGIGLLLAAGAAYGGKKVYDIYRKRKQ